MTPEQLRQRRRKRQRNEIERQEWERWAADIEADMNQTDKIGGVLAVVVAVCVIAGVLWQVLA